MAGLHRSAPEEEKKMKDFARTFYRSKQWQAAREEAIRRDQYLCQDCLKKGRITPAEEVHHITELTPDNINDPSIALNTENLISLCRECHKERHGARARRYVVDDFGRVTVR